jgi:hypothetical protein
VVLDLRYRCNLTAVSTGIIPRSACLYTATNCSVTRPNTEITCSAAPGSGIRHSWRVEVSGAAATSTPSLSTLDNPQITGYDIPFVAEVNAPVLKTRGGDTVRCV